jgi:hypothetical protein
MSYRQDYYFKIRIIVLLSWVAVQDKVFIIIILFNHGAFLPPKSKASVSSFHLHNLQKVNIRLFNFCFILSYATPRLKALIKGSNF